MMNTAQEELIFQVKNMLGITAILLDHMPEYVQFHLCRVAAKLSTALCVSLEMDDLKVSEVQHIAMRDVLLDWQNEESIPAGLQRVISDLLAHLDSHSAEETAEEDEEISLDQLKLFNIWPDDENNPLN
jgi:hypothetical protein